MLQEHSAILSTFIKLPFVLRSLFCLFLNGRFTQVLLYNNRLNIPGVPCSDLATQYNLKLQLFSIFDFFTVQIHW